MLPNVYTNIDLSICDNAEDLPDFFYCFYHKTEGVVSGKSLGIAIVKEIIERHEGRVNVVCKIGEGSTFTFHCPII
ncbi:ATP-binding protein [Psychrobacillus sp. L4]|uniref:ATP-binding protein n=1 Tax=Psychrobacillus sp. L4 TaxID=3236892 RepID=UPI0036F1AADF